MKRRDEVKILSTSDTAKALTGFMAYMVIIIIHFNITGLESVIFIGFLPHLGLDRSLIGIIAFLTLGIMVLQPALLTVSDKIKKKKRLIIFGVLISGSLYCFVVLVPMFFPVSWSLVFLLICVMGASFINSVVYPYQNSWNASIMHKSIRATYIGKRNAYASVVGIAAVLVAARVLDIWPGYWSFFFVYLFAFFALFTAVFILNRVPFKQIAKTSSMSTGEIYLLPFTDRKFGSIVFLRVFSFIAITTGRPFYTVYMLDYLKLSYTVTGLYNTLPLTVALVLGFLFWGALVKRYSSKPILQIVILPYIFIPLSWLIIRSETSFLIPLIWFVDGFLTAGMFIGTVNMIYEYVPTDDRQPGYYAVWSAMMNVSMGIGPFIGYLVLNYFRGLRVNIMGMEFMDIHFVFVCSAFLILLPYIFISKVPDTKAKTPLYVFGQLTRGNPLRYAFNLYIYQQFKNVNRRGKAVKKMGLSESPMAVSSLEKALDDISPLVRKQAVIGLGNTKLLEAAPALIEQLNSPDSELRAESALALGNIPTAEVIETLLDTLVDSDMIVRNYATLALGKIGGKKVKDKLYDKLMEGFDREHFPNIIEALSIIGDYRIIDHVMEHYLEYPSTARRLDLLNAVFRLLRAGDSYASFLSKGEIGQQIELQDIIREMIEMAKKNPSVVKRETVNMMVDILLGGLKRKDIRVKKSAVENLNLIGGKKARDGLFEYMTACFNRQLFPVIADALGSMKDKRIIGPVIDNLEKFSKPAIQIQLLNSICNVIGSGADYYHLVSLDRFDQATAMTILIARIIRNTRRIRFLSDPSRDEIVTHLELLLDTYQDDRHKDFLDECSILAGLIQLQIPEDVIDAHFSSEEVKRIRPHIEAVERFLVLKKTEDIQNQGMVFIMVCYDNLINDLLKMSIENSNGFL